MHLDVGRKIYSDTVMAEAESARAGFLYELRRAVFDTHLTISEESRDIVHKKMNEGRILAHPFHDLPVLVYASKQVSRDPRNVSGKIHNMVRAIPFNLLDTQDNSIWSRLVSFADIKLIRDVQDQLQYLADSWTEVRREMTTNNTYEKARTARS